VSGRFPVDPWRYVLRVRCLTRSCIWQP